jgi:carboxyl-terminal PDZ ligand of neuronal nitric oxide synthase protein
MSQQQKILADGWGNTTRGSVFCAESSLRFLYEQHPNPSTDPMAAAITSLSSGEYQHHHAQNVTMTKQPTTLPVGYPLLLGVKTSVQSQHQVQEQGVDLFEAEIAKSCMAITRQVNSMPHSFRECSVCLSQNAYTQIVACAHVFHSKCFLRWFRTNRSCPLCRGQVDKIQIAPTLASNAQDDELEAIMAEIDATNTKNGNDMDISAGLDLMDASHTGEFSLSFLDNDLEIEDMVPLDDVIPLDNNNNQMKIQTEDMDISMDDVENTTNNRNNSPSAPMTLFLSTPTPPVVAAAPSMQFAPSTTLPNYWNVLNNGMACPPILPSNPLPPPHQQRMVHIAPRPIDPMFMVHNHHQMYEHIDPSHAHPYLKPSTTISSSSSSSSLPRVVSCRCSGGCRNGRCACVKEGGMCGVSCRCTSCRNPFTMVKKAGANIEALLKDSCFMHNVPKTKDMVQRMQEPVQVPCCNQTITVLVCVLGYTCSTCENHPKYQYSWCLNKLCDAKKNPRNHCDICKRCADHRDIHCHDCGRCYFAGVTATLPCPCKDSSKRRRDGSNGSGSGSGGSVFSSPQSLTGASTIYPNGSNNQEEEEEECIIM